MPAVTAVQIGIITVTAIVGVVLGWSLRARRCAQEKTAINTGWQEQIEAQRLEHARLVEQNKSLMEQVGRFKASAKDAVNRAKELSAAVIDVSGQRDELHREIADVRDGLDAAQQQRHQLETDLHSASANDRSLSAALQKKDEKIFKLSRELDDWQQRVPPLVDRYRERNTEAEQLEIDLAEARARIHALETVLGSEQTRVEPVDQDALANNMDASNDTMDTGIRPNDPMETDIRAHGSLVDLLRDDLKCIKGIGPAIEKTLNELGIFRLSQIAEMTEYDIDRVASRLKGFRSRIYREDWIGQARELQGQLHETHH